METSAPLLEKLSPELPCGPAGALLGTEPKGETETQADGCTPTFTAACFPEVQGGTSQGFLTDTWMKRMWDVTGKNIKRNEILVYATT